MALNWSTTSQVNLRAGVKVLAYGESGMGKTAICATAPRPLIISAESGLLSLRKQNLEKLYGVGNPEITYDIPIIAVTNVNDVAEALQWILFAKEAAYFDTICMDSASEIAEVILNNAKRQVKDPRQAYGELIEKMETTIRAFRDIPEKHVYISAKSEWAKDELTGVVRNGPSMPGSKLGQKLPYFFDEVFRLGINKTPQNVQYRFLQTQPDLQNIAKDRSGALDAIEEPHLTHVFNKILSGVN